jgi:hypothetical protein
MPILVFIGIKTKIVSEFGDDFCFYSNKDQYGHQYIARNPAIKIIGYYRSSEGTTVPRQVWRA